MRFVAIDFETANHRADSACQLAAVVIQNSDIVAEHSWLIRPRKCTFLHATSPSMASDQGMLSMHLQ